MFIAFEGGDGAGKSTQVAALAEHLRAGGFEVVTTREPGGTPLGARIREMLLHADEVSPRAEALLFAADRAHHVDTLIRPALARGAIVLTDRYVDSSLAYQGAGRALAVDDVAHLSTWATSGLVPDLTVLLDIDSTEGRTRRSGRTEDRMETEAAAFHDRVRAHFRALAAAEPDRYLVLDATLPVEELSEQIRARVSALLPASQGGRSA
ncbi:MAG: dTMP kinase [Mobilicoccus sp.]|nr:dTMP kinase [Mobilicoccus sp.]